MALCTGVGITRDNVSLLEIDRDIQLFKETTGVTKSMRCSVLCIHSPSSNLKNVYHKRAQVEIWVQG